MLQEISIEASVARTQVEDIAAWMPDIQPDTVPGQTVVEEQTPSRTFQETDYRSAIVKQDLLRRSDSRADEGVPERTFARVRTTATQPDQSLAEPTDSEPSVVQDDFSQLGAAFAGRRAS